MAEKKNIYESIHAVMEEVGAIGKQKRNAQQGFLYRGIDDVMNALNPALINHRLFIVPEVMEHRREERQTVKGGNLIYSVCRVKYTFYAEDGSHVEAVVVGEGMDSGDKASNKALSAAFKYACFQVFCIPTEEMLDPDAEIHKTRPSGHQDAPPTSRPQKESSEPRISQEQFNDLMRECERTGKSWRAICGLYKVEKFTDMTVEQYHNCMENFKKTPDKKTPRKPPADPVNDEELPWYEPPC